MRCLARDVDYGHGDVCRRDQERRHDAGEAQLDLVSEAGSARTLAQIEEGWPCESSDAISG